ncbi:putative hydrolase of the HAD superfamily [Chryseobacterium bernardetii]|uniref:Hydrolase of the HAD superfamily n=2 Tax=Chryseobacterium TaxID=59732 RepID=A0ACC6J097_9FLAO|nr:MULTISPECIES: HAD-IA family hydrolase [Chryseobacterium]MDR6371781.1 putative hydrolase of the HAD superfamily [Chryseobacterium vietnamense]MDR6443269.1 putative hydrolase of the HAD superfamily [Chryseobacterium bernardetii]MDR6488573.1 putative hydrolase of the HAD superfamily [Chryseobacterium vietnamense]TQM18196.1 putative hydrolase of the HAD superfamily [Chryseobacterium aquifrigidense]
MKTDIDIHNHCHFSFDLWLTLIKSHPEFKAKRVELFSSFFNVDKPLEEVAKTVKYYDDLCNTINEVTGGNIDTFEIYLMILGSLDIDVKQLNKEKLNEFYNKSEELFLEYRPVVIFENIHDFFDDIKNQGKTINILSNTGFIKGTTMRKFLIHENLDQYIDFHIYSDEINCSKPNPLIFQEVKNNIQDQDLPMHQILHIGDNPVADYQGAKNFGFSAHLLKH